MLNELQSFMKTPLGAALVERLTQRGNEDLKQAFAAGDEMTRLLSKAHKYMEKTDPQEAAEFARATQRVVAHYREHAARYLEIRSSY
ncbi:MAG: hypothetical protein FWH34_04320 [Desulfovibrionaceae bacterium]|nr:hypothetical protein [Desulfovibrionaceae bacterium]